MREPTLEPVNESDDDIDTGHDVHFRTRCTDPVLPKLTTDGHDTAHGQRDA